jgi:hypothetical protein
VILTTGVWRHCLSRPPFPNEHWTHTKGWQQSWDSHFIYRAQRFKHLGTVCKQFSSKSMQDPLTSVGAGWRFVQLLWTFKDRWVSPFLSRHLTPCTVVHIQSSPEWRRLQQCLKWSLQPCRPMTKAAWFPARTGQFTRQSTTLVHTSVCLLNQAVCSVKELIPSRAPVAHTYNPSYSGGRNQEDHGLKSVWENSSWDSISKKPFTIKGWLLVAQGVGPEFKTQTAKKKTKKSHSKLK